MENIRNIVYETSVKEIENLNNLSISEINKNPNLLKVSQLKNQHILAIIKQEDIDYKAEDLRVRSNAQKLRDERNKVMKEHIEVQEKKIVNG